MFGKPRAGWIPEQLSPRAFASGLNTALSQHGARSQAEGVVVLSRAHKCPCRGYVGHLFLRVLKVKSRRSCSAAVLLYCRTGLLYIQKELRPTITPNKHTPLIFTLPIPSSILLSITLSLLVVLFLIVNSEMQSALCLKNSKRPRPHSAFQRMWLFSCKHQLLSW